MTPASRRAAAPPPLLARALVARALPAPALLVRALLARALLGVALVALATAPRPAAAQFTLLEGDGARLTLTGYARGFTGVHDRGFDLPALAGQTPRTTGFHGQVVRVKWQLEGDAWALDVHDRLQARVSSGEGEGPALGFGVSAVPDRLLDLEAALVEEPGVRVWHDVDRLSVTAHTDAADLTVGRQPITWGVSTLFPVADLWAQFSPFELDTEEKRGIDAVRALFYPGDRIEMDAVVAHRGDIDDLSLGVRGTWGLAGADVWAGAGKFWREAMVMGGATLLFEERKLRGELVLPWGLDGGGLQDPRVTVGVDWIRGSLLLTGEYHYNGIGAGDPAGYADRLQDPRVARGETYYLGRHYLGGLASWSPDEENRLALGLTALTNLGDGSAAFTPTASYDLGQAARVAVGGLLSLGETPAVSLLPPLVTLGSEFGSYGDMVFTTVSVYF